MLAAALLLSLADSPADAVRQFVAAWQKADLVAAARLVDGADPNADRRELAAFIASQKGTTLEIVAMNIIGSRVLVDVEMKARDVRARRRNPKPELGPEDEVFTVRRADGWKIVPAPLERIMELSGASAAPNGKEGLNPSLITILATVIKEPRMQASFIKGAMSGSTRTLAMGRMKELALASIQYASDQDDVFKMTRENVRSLITPYLKDKKAFLDPATGRENVYLFNPWLANVSMVAIDSPATTPLWYLGEGDNVLYPYEGKTIVAFADGSVKVLSQPEVLKLRWKP
ncbi:hypothetical protein EON79_01070 [bacterium]|nr:MAG: hypothetical protein EON79_01070 [bacterium]